MDIIQVSDDDTRDGFVEITGLGEDGEVWVPVVIVAAHVHPAIEHYLFVIDRYYYTALPYLLSSTCNERQTLLILLIAKS